MSSISTGDRRSKKPSGRPDLQIYRPPGLRNTDDAANSKPNSIAGSKQLKKDILSKQQHGQVCKDYSTKCISWNTSDGCMHGTEECDLSLARADSALSSESTGSSQTSDRSQNLPKPIDRLRKTTKRHVDSNPTNGILKEGNRLNSTEIDRPKKEAMIKSVSHKDLTAKRKSLSAKDCDELAIALRKLDFAEENATIEQFISSNFSNDSIAESVGHALVHLSIEENRQSGKVVSRIAAQLLDSAAAQVFHKGIISSLMRYFDCRDRLRVDHFRVWIAFLNFVSDLYSAIGYVYEGELVDLVFHIFDYMLKVPVLDNLKIEELESLIGCLLSAGYDLERQCPEKLAVLKDLIRDALVEVQEPWARKMILLLLELGASGWKLPPEANEYYFQHTSS